MAACRLILAVALMIQHASCFFKPDDSPDYYDEEEAKMMASLSSVCSCHDESQILDWTCQACKDSKTPMAPGKVRVIDAGNYNATRIIIGKLRDQPGCLLAFRGSSNTYNWIRDFQITQIEPVVFGDCTGCKVHSGFFNIWKRVEDDVIRGLRDVGCEEGGKDELIYVTGVSLGAAMSHMAIFALDYAGFKVAKSYTFESPRVGNQAFAEAFDKAFARRFPVFRVTHHKDPAVHVPPMWMGYRHVGTEAFYDGGLGEYKICEKMEDKACSNKYWNLPSMLLFNRADHCTTPLVPTGNMCEPVGCDDPKQSLQV
jgi:hypothetical protein